MRCAASPLASGPPRSASNATGRSQKRKALRPRPWPALRDDRVTFRGWGQPAAVADFIRSLDALALLTRTTKAVREQFGRVIIEAQACGVPVIGSTCGAIPDVVGDGGWIVPERDAKALRGLLDKIASDRALVRDKGLAARENVQARFTYDAVARALQKACAAAAQAAGR
jgi:glycosyltransferase involved in cell wall biosynthesis